MEEINIYCDESCHLEHDNSNVMTIGGVYCPKHKVKEINKRIMEIKKKYGVYPNSEIKWTKVSLPKYKMYEELINYFFDDDDLSFRCLIADKTTLDFDKYKHSHEDWYYKMYFDMLKVILNPENQYHIYLDIMNTHSIERVKTLENVLRNNAYDFSSKIIKSTQVIRSNEVQLMQIVDVLTGAVCYTNRTFPDGFEKNKAKVQIIELIKKRSGYSLNKKTLYRSKKVNLFVWGQYD